METEKWFMYLTGCLESDKSNGRFCKWIAYIYKQIDDFLLSANMFENQI